MKFTVKAGLFKSLSAFFIKITVDANSIDRVSPAILTKPPPGLKLKTIGARRVGPGAS